MSSTTVPAAPFIDRRDSVPPIYTAGTATTTSTVAGRERRQFANSHDHLSPEASELATSIDQYKMQHRRRFINFEEMLAIMKSLGYSK